MQAPRLSREQAGPLCGVLPEHPLPRLKLPQQLPSLIAHRREREVHLCRCPAASWRHPGRGSPNRQSELHCPRRPLWRPA
eukprot:scaffold651685_cov37-Prasinocladus_malaysianus.AAC.1